MVLEALVWKTSPGACEVEPPDSGRGPWSTTVTRSQPRTVSSYARFAPTIPAPMMTTRGVVDISLLLTCRWIRGLPTTGRSALGGGELEGRVEQPVGEIAGEGRPDEDDVVVAGVGQCQQHDPGLAERGLRAPPPAEHPRVQVDRAALGQDVAHPRARQPQADPLGGDVRRGTTQREDGGADPGLQLFRRLRGAGE